MGARLKKQVQDSKPFQKLIKDLATTRSITAKNVKGSLKALIAVSLAELMNKNIFYICRDVDQAEIIRDDLSTLANPNDISYFPYPGQHLSDDLTIPPAVLGARLATVEKILQSPTRQFYITVPETLVERLPRLNYFQEQRIEFRAGVTLELAQCIETLVNMNFVREAVVTGPGELSVRGGILDIYPYSHDLPVRIELFGDCIESLREFDPDTQRSLRPIHQVSIFPQKVIIGEYLDTNNTATLFDYLPEDTIFILDEYETIAAKLHQVRQAADGCNEGNEIDVMEDTLVDQPATPAWDALQTQMIRHLTLCFSSFPNVTREYVDFATTSSESFHGDISSLRTRVEQLLAKTDNTWIYFLCENDSQQQRIRELFFDEGLAFSGFKIESFNLGAGFHYPAAGLHVYTNHEFFGRRRSIMQHRSLDYKISLRQLNSLEKGDSVVHVDFGIGLYRGLNHIMVNQAERECLAIEYRDGDMLYVPIERMDRVQKYSSREGFIPPLTKLGTLTWEKLKSRAKKKIKDIAEELIRVNALRKLTPGFEFEPDHQWQKELEASFPYEDTPDQATVTEEVKRDMESRRPMDRLVCGDVGFGKTEIAIRAAFKAVQSNKQVAVLVPTTVLAQQHFNTFSDRLEKYPVTIEMLSRFRKPAQQKQIIEDLKAGKIDIVIGTHRLLSRDVSFLDLGLLIIDEEQRFGVVHKEKIKLLRSTVDVLTLTATPIPRTLHMAMMGARDLSIINTPPHDRQPIVTEVTQFNKDLIREAILREVDRGGQVYFVHNRVQTIFAMKQLLQDLMPDLKFVIAHGQMPSQTLERVMIDFMNGKYHCLVSSMIIENGLDIPRVNTLIVNRADRFGLSQLYQLRGRVGRSKQRAYAYLLVPPFRRLKPEAIKRLQTIQEYTHLGSGYQIALRDLEIRGTGNLLGTQQSGFIDSLGFDLFTKIVNDAVRELQQKNDPEQAKESRPPVEVKLEVDVDAYLPKNYVTIDSERVEIYRRLLNVDSLQHLDELEEELRDRFGRLPQPAQNLIQFVAIKRLAESIYLKHLKINDSELRGIFDMSVFPRKDQFARWIKSLLDSSDREIFFISTKTLTFRVRLDQNDRLKDAKIFLQSLN